MIAVGKAKKTYNTAAAVIAEEEVGGIMTMKLVTVLCVFTRDKGSSPKALLLLAISNSPC